MCTPPQPENTTQVEILPQKSFMYWSDGYLRLTVAEIAAVPLHHLLSDLINEPTSAAIGGAQTTTIRGYTEWNSRTRPAISIGWDWELGSHLGRVSCRRIGDPYSNVLLVGPEEELGINYDRAYTRLGSLVDGLAWQEAVLRVLDQSYGGHCQI